MQTTIKPAVESDKALIDDMLQAYALDLLPYMDIPRSENGRFEYPELDTYWQEPEDRFPFLIEKDGQVAGFVLVNRCFNFIDPTAWSIEEFYIAREFRRTGVGKVAARQAFHRFPGRWEVDVIASNKPALAFWDVVIGQTAAGEITRHDWSAGDISFLVYTFSVAPR